MTTSTPADTHGTTPNFPGLAGKVALITGGTSGIGRATALTAARAGVHVVITGRREKEGAAVAAEIRKLGVQSLFVQGDVSKEADQRRFVAEALKINGKLSLVFNNAGIEGIVGPHTHEQTEQNFHDVFNINVLGVLLGIKHQVPALLKSGGGSIVNNSSVAGSVGLAGMGVYVASKHAVLGLTRSAALEYATLGVRINTVSPAAIKTDMFDRFTGGPETDFAKHMASLHPIGRVGEAREIAEPVLFLWSDAASFITGFDLKVDGGLTVP